MPTKISVFAYDNYRIYIKELFDQNRKVDGSFSLRKFSKGVGIQSMNFLSLVINGKRNISMDMAERIGGAMKLNEVELSYFKSLVGFCQAEKVEEKTKYAAAMIRFKGFSRLHPLAALDYNYFSKWYYVAIRELATTVDFKEDPQWISERLNPKVSVEQAAQALDELKTLGMLKVDETGKLTEAQAPIVTPVEVHSVFAKAFHQEMIKKAGESIDRFPREQREITASTIAVTEEGFRQVKSMIQEFAREVLAKAESFQKPDEIYQLNFQFFPLIKKEGSK